MASARQSKIRGLAVLAVLFSSLGAPLWAQEPSSLAVSSGAANLLRLSENPQVNWELHFQPRDLRLPRGLLLRELIPITGIMASSDGALYAYAGGRVERPLGRRWMLIPSWAAGLYDRGDGKVLGGVVEFRSGVELAFRLRGLRSVGVALYHMSNAHLYHDNPGTESLLLTYGAGVR